MLNNRIVAKESEVKFPDGTAHAAEFQGLLGDAYSAALHTGKSVQFFYLGQTDPAPTEALVSSFALARESEVCVAVVRLLATAQSAGKLPDAAIRELIKDLSSMLPESEG